MTTEGTNRCGWRVNEWCALAGFSPATYYNLAPEDRPISLKLGGMRLICETPKEYFSRLNAPRPPRDLQLIPRDVVMQITALTGDEIQEQMNAGTFPKCTRTGLWERGEVLDWVQRVIDERDMSGAV